MVVENGGAFIEAARVRGFLEFEQFEIQMVTEFVTERAEECAVGGDLLLNSGPHPDAHELGNRMVVAKQLRRPTLADPHGAGGQDLQFDAWYLIEVRGCVEELQASFSGGSTLAGLQREFEPPGGNPQPVVFWNGQ